MGKQLSADYVLEGSVLRSGQHLRIDAQLIRVRDDFPLWSDRYDRELTDIFAIQDEISRGIVNSLRLKLGGRRRYETSAEAYDLYLKGRAISLRPLASGVRESIPLLEQAVAKDPSFAPAYAALARAHSAFSGFDRANRGDELVKMREIAAKALQLDPLLAEAHDATALVLARDAQWAAAEKSFRRSLELDPNDARIHQDYALFLLLPVGRLREALTQTQFAVKMDPLSDGAQADMAYVLRGLGRVEEMATHCKPRSDCLAWARIEEGRIDEAIGILEPGFKESSSLPGAGLLGYAYARANRREEAEKLAAEAPRPLEKAMVFAGLGDKERTLAALEGVAALGPIRLGRALTYPEFAFLRVDVRIAELRKKTGLP